MANQPGELSTLDRERFAGFTRSEQERTRLAKYDLDDGECRIWWATLDDKAFVLHLLKIFREHEFFWVPDRVIEREIGLNNILCFDYRVLEAGYIWITRPHNGRGRINQLA